MKTVRALAVCILGLASFSRAYGSDTPWALAAEGSLASDFIERGYSRSPSRPSVHLGLRLTHESGFVAGISATSVVFESTPYFPYSTEGVEGRGFIGYTLSFGRDWRASLSGLYYRLPDLIPGEDLSYEEVDLSLVFRELFSLTIANSNEVFKSGLEALYFELSGRYPLPRGVDLMAGAGYARFSPASGRDYFYGHGGIARRFGRIDAEVALFLSDAPPIPSWGRSFERRWVLTFSLPIFSVGRSRVVD